MPEHRIILFGATGYTGRLVAHALAASGRHTPFLLAGRDPARLDRLAADLGGAETAAADALDPSSLDRLIGAGDIVIDCAGPFIEIGEPVVRACAESGAHYLDTTGEQAFMKRILDHWDDVARAAGSIVVNAMAFEYALGDCAAALAAEGLERPLRSVDIAYAWPAAATASRGTLRSILRILAAPGVTYVDGEWRPARIADETTTLELPDGSRRSAFAFPSGEALTVPRHLEVAAVRAWIVAGRWTARLASAAAPVLPALTRIAMPTLDRLLAITREGPPAEDREAGRFTITLWACAANGERRLARIRGRDAYGLTAAIAVHGAHTIRELSRRPREARPAGVLPPASVLDPRAFLDGLRRHGLEWETIPDDGRPRNGVSS